jgi:hypothetical protein
LVPGGSSFLVGCDESLGAAGDITTSNVVDDDKAGDWGGSEQDNLVEELSTASSIVVFSF